MADFYKEMYNYNKMESYVDSEISDVEESIPQIMFVNFTDDGASTVTCDKTFTEIASAIQNGKPIIGFAHNTLDGHRYQLSSVTQETGSTSPISFSAIATYVNSKPTVYSYIVSSSGITSKIDEFE